MSKSIPKYALVERHIKEAIQKKLYINKLPGERTLAKKLGLSYMTVRKAIDSLVNEQVLYRVPTKGTFIVNKKAKQTRSNTIGYFLDSEIKSGIASPYYSLILNALEKEAAKHHVDLVYFSDTSKSRFFKTLKKLDGVVASCFPWVEPAIQEIKRSLPLVVIDNPSDDRGIPSVIIDNYDAVTKTVDYMVSLGHKRIGFMTGLHNSDVGTKRFTGFRDGLTRHDLRYEEALVYHGDYSFESGVAGADYFMTLKRRPTAIICANDSMALGSVKRFSQMGLVIPDDMSIVGFDDIEVASQITPALTTVAAPVDDIARHAFAMLNDLIHGKPLDIRHVTLGAEIVTRQTCTGPAAGSSRRTDRNGRSAA